jgi:hypothetical protein
VALIFVSILWAPLTTTVPEPPFDGSSQGWLSYALATHGQAGIQSAIGALGMLGFLLFAASLVNRLAIVGGPTSMPSTLVILTGGLVIALWLAATGLGIAVAFRERTLDAEGAGLLYGIANGLFVVSWFALGGFLFAVGLGTLGGRGLPQWLAWPAFGIGAGFFAAGALPLAQFWLVPYLLFYGWVLATSVVLLIAHKDETLLAADQARLGEAGNRPRRVPKTADHGDLRARRSGPTPIYRSRAARISLP